MRPTAIIAAIAGLAAGVVAAIVTVAIASSNGAFDGSTTVITAGAATVAPVNVTTSQSDFDPAAIYRARIRGVVTITSVFPDGEAGGSGFVVSNDGLILTNAHVVTNSADQNVQATDVRPAGHVFVRFQNGDQISAGIVGYDLFADVAVLRVSADGEKLQPVPLGNSSRVRVGEPVAAIGSPFLEAGSLSVGVVSAINRSLSSGTGFAIPGAIQTDAAINHGNSGGPLFNSAGEVIGINAQIQTTSGGGEGVGFAVPIDLVRHSMQQLVEHGKVSYGWLGVRLSTVTPAIADRFGLAVQHGALLVEVTPGGPADDAGLKVAGDLQQFQNTSIRPDGDIITAVNGRPVLGSDQFVRLVAEAAPGQVLHLQVQRGDQSRSVNVTLGVRPL